MNKKANQITEHKLYNQCRLILKKDDSVIYVKYGSPNTVTK